MAEAAWINNDAGTPEYNAQELRRIQSMFLFPGTHRFGARAGVRPTGQGIVSTSGTTWTQHDLTAVVYPGLTTISGPYVAEKTAESASFDPADGSNPRIDALDLQIRDDDEDASTFRDLRVVYVAGTPAGSPAEPPLTANSLRIGTFNVPAGGSPSPSVRSQAHWTVAAGGVLPVRTAAELPTAGRYEGMYADQADTEALMRWNGTAWVPVGNSQGYQFGGRVIYTSTGNFVKANFPGLRAIDVTVGGGGGGSGGVAACGAGEAAEAGGGAGGSGSKQFINDMSLLATTETATVGAGGNGGSTGANPGSAGGESRFSVLGLVDVVAPGGGGGAGGAASSTAAVTAGGSAGAPGSGGDINIQGSTGGNGVIRQGESIRNNFGGHAAFGLGPAVLTFGASSTGEDGHNYGGGASGPRNNDGDSGQGGQPGQSGIIIIDLYY